MNNYCSGYFHYFYFLLKLSIYLAILLILNKNSLAEGEFNDQQAGKCPEKKPEEGTVL